MDTCGDKYPICVSEDGVVLNDVARVRRGNQSNSKVISLRCIAISTEPVPTEPVAAGAACQSYTSTRIGRVPVSDRDVILQQMP